MTALFVIVGLYVGAHIIILWRYGIGGFIGLYLMTLVAWLYFYGYNSSLADFLWTNIVMLTLCTLGAFLPRGPIGVAVGGTGGYFLGRYLSKL